MKNQIFTIIAYVLIGFLLGLNIASRKEVIVTDTVFKTDTCYVHSIDVVQLERLQIQHRVIRDTIVQSGEVPKIQAYSTRFPIKYGTIGVSGEVYGEILKMNIDSDIKVPLVTNTITNTVVKKESVVKNPGGLFVTAGVHSDLKPTVGAVFVKNKFVGGYNYTFDQHHIYIGRKLF